MRIYISIPITGKDIKQQTRLADLLADRLMGRGHTPVNPLDVHAPDGLNERDLYAYYMGEDIKRLMTCDAILMADQKWPRSKGCTIEHFIAGKMGLEIYYTVYDTPDNRNKSH